MSARDEALRVVDWFLSGDTGISSKTICLVMTGGTNNDRLGSPPLDGGDFGRCYRLLRRFPMWKLRLSEVAERFPEWGPLVESWDELTSLYESYCNLSTGEVDYYGDYDKAASKKLYNRISELLEEGAAIRWASKTDLRAAKASAEKMGIDLSDRKKCPDGTLCPSPINCGVFRTCLSSSGPVQKKDEKKTEETIITPGKTKK